MLLLVGHCYKTIHNKVLLERKKTRKTRPMSNRYCYNHSGNSRRIVLRNTATHQPRIEKYKMSHMTTVAKRKKGKLTWLPCLTI